MGLGHGFAGNGIHSYVNFVMEKPIFWTMLCTGQPRTRCTQSADRDLSPRLTLGRFKAQRFGL